MNLSKIRLYILTLQMAATISFLYTIPVTIALRPEGIMNVLVNFGISLIICMKYNPIAREIWDKWRNKQ